MKRIAVFIPTIKAGGAEKQAALLAIVLAKTNLLFFVSFYGHSQESPIVSDLLEKANVNIVYLEGSLFRKFKDYYLFLKESKIDICFNYLTLCDVIGGCIEKMAGVKKIYNGIRNCRLAPAKVIGEWFAHNFIADYTIYNSYSGARSFEAKGFKKRKTIIISNCFSNISEPIKRDPRERKRIITVARFQTQKDYETTIRTIADVKRERQDFEFIIIGHGSLEHKIRKWIKDYAIEDCTIVYIAPSNVQDILKSADIYLSTSLFEGTSNSIMEAMNWSIPIVATNVGDNDRLIHNGVNGFLTKIRDNKALSQNIITLLDNDNLRIEMGIKGNELLHQYSEEHFEEEYLKLLTI